MFYEWVLILLLAISGLLTYLVLLFRQLLAKLGSLETTTAQMQQAPAVGAVQTAEVPISTNQQLDDEIAAVITAAIAAYEQDK